jgi:PTS system fructose-specific IIC component
MQITDYLGPQSIKVPMKATTRWEAIEELLDLLAQQSSVGDRKTVFARIRDRENLVPDGAYVGDLVAMPHYGGIDCEGKRVAIGIFAAPIDWTGDQKPVQIVVLTIVQGSSKEVVYAPLSRMSEILKPPQVREAVLQSRTASDVYECIIREDRFAEETKALPNQGLKLWRSLT